MKSEIFEAYAAEMETLLEGRDDLVKEARTPKQIQKDLYGIVPNKKMKPILERAHPHGGYVVAPAYDPANGVMATPGETQALVGGVANSDANGNYFQKSWIQATEDLKEELIGIAFELDNKEELELMKLADSCAERLEKKSSLIANGTGVLSVAAWLVKKVAVFALPFLGMTLLDKALSGGGPRASGAATTSRGAEKAAAGRIRSIKRSLPAVGRMGVIGVKLGAFYFAFKGLANLIGPISQGLDNDAQDVLGAIEEAIPEVGPQDGQRLREIGARVTGLMESSRSWQQAAAQVPAEAPSAY